jgi:hypothetical protein
MPHGKAVPARATVGMPLLFYSHGIRLRHTAQHAQPSTPQNDFKSAIGSLPDQARA